VGDTLLSENGLVVPCTFNEVTGQMEGTCARCACSANFEDVYTTTPQFDTFIDDKSLAYGCSDCTATYYPKADTKEASDTICTAECSEDICSNRGVCMRDSGECSCFGSCPTDSSTYDGECLMRSFGMQPHLSPADNCAECQSNWGPNLDIWQGSCIYFCNAAASAEDNLPVDCYKDGNIINECIFCSGRASNCSSLSGQPSCNCEGDFTGRYCQNTCGSCNNGVCEENRLYNFFLLDVPEYEKKDAQSFSCQCLSVDTEDRLSFERDMYSLVAHDLSMDRSFLTLPPIKQYYGEFCASSCKRGSDDSICNSFGDCKSASVVGLGGTRSCTTDTDCNTDPSNPFIEDSNYFCSFTKVPKFWQYIRNLETYSQCSTEEVSFIHNYIDTNDWTDFCYNYVNTNVPTEVYHNDCKDCGQLVYDMNFWNSIDTSCGQFLQYANQETFIDSVAGCGTCSYEIANFNWEEYCELPSADFVNTCPTQCIDKFKEVDWVNDNGFCAKLETFTENHPLQETACDIYNNNNVCTQLGQQENSYDSNTLCFTEREAIQDATTNTIITNPYSGSLRTINCKSVTDNQPEVCGTIQKIINPVKQACNPNNLNVLNTGLNECDLRDQEHTYCTTLLGESWTNGVVECALTIPRCLYCGLNNDIYEVGVNIDIVDIDSTSYNNDPSKCCRPNDVMIFDGSKYQCYEGSSYSTVCRYDDCKTNVQNIDWTSKLNALDNVKNLNDIDIPALDSLSVRRSINISAYCDVRKTLDVEIELEIGLESFKQYCEYVSNHPVENALTFENTYALENDIQLELNFIKSEWWRTNIGDVFIDNFDMNFYIQSGFNELISTSNTYTVTNKKIFNTWIYIPEVTNDYIFSIGFSAEDRVILQLDLRAKKLYANNNDMNIYESTNGWHRLGVFLHENVTDIVWQHQVSAEEIRLNIPLLCRGCTLETVDIESLGTNSIILHDIRFTDTIYGADSYFFKSLNNIGVSSTLDANDCTQFLVAPLLETLLCPDNSCTNLLQKQNWGRTCANYFSAVTLADEEIEAVCSTDSDCIDRVNTWDYASFYDEYTFNDRPHQTRTSECSTQQCDTLLENFDYIALCDSSLRDVSESCSECSTAFDNWLATFNKQTFCSNIAVSKSNVKDVFVNEMHNCSSSCRQHLDDVNFYEFCYERNVFHSAYSPNSLSFNISKGCRNEIFSYDDAYDTQNDCVNLGLTGGVDPGECHRVFCDCNDPTVGGDRCNIQCSLGTDNSACNENSNLGTCCLETNDELTVSNCVTDIVDDDTSLFPGECLCFGTSGAEILGGENCDTFCDFCSVSNGKCQASGACKCRNNPYEETIESNFYTVETITVSENNLKFDWANAQSIGLENGLWNIQEPLYLLWTNEESCHETPIDKCCIWDDFVNNHGNPLHDNYDRNVISSLPSNTGINHVCTTSITECIKYCIQNDLSTFEFDTEKYSITNPYKNWPLKGEVRITEEAMMLEPQNSYNPSTYTQAFFQESKCPSYKLTNGYYRVEAQKNTWIEESTTYDASVSYAFEAKSVYDLYLECQLDKECEGIWKGPEGYTKKGTGDPAAGSATTLYKKPEFHPVPTSTSLSVYFKNQWCAVKAVDGNAIVGNQAAGFISEIDCTRPSNAPIETSYTTCKFPFFADTKDRFGNFRSEKITACTDEDLFDSITETKIFDFDSLKAEITSATGIQNPKYCVSETYFMNMSHFNKRGENGYCQINDGAYAKCTNLLSDNDNCVCGNLRCSVNEYCYVKDFDSTVLHECHSCSDMLSPEPQRCCPQNTYLVDGECKEACNEHWACRYNEVSTQSGNSYTYDGVEFQKGEGPYPELYCSDNCWNPFTQVCESCDLCKQSTLKNPIDILKQGKIGGYHYAKEDGSFTFDNTDVNIPFMRICQDSANVIQNNNFALSVESKQIHDDVEFVMTDRKTAANPSSSCGDSCHDICPASSNGVPCSGNGICNKDCTCSCYTLDSNEKFILSNMEGLGLQEVPQFSVGSAMAFKSPYRGDACEKTCPGWEEGAIPNSGLSDADKQFIMGELICSGHGSCLVNDVGEPMCQCETGYINGKNMNCEFQCPGNECNGHGACIVSLQGTPEIFVPDLYVHNGEESISNIVMQKVNELFPSKSVFYSDEYYGLPEAVKDTQSQHFSTLKYLSKCPLSHPYPYNNGKYCCVFEKVANGTTINKRSGIDECSYSNRIRCPTNDYYGDTVSEFIDPFKQTTPSDICRSSIKTLEEEAFCEEEQRIIELNTFTTNPDDYTCDMSVGIVNMRRNTRPFYDPMSILQLGAGDTDSVMYKYNDVYCSNIVASDINSHGKTLDEQPQPITLLECATCTCQKSATSGFWDGVICDDCAFGFHGESCSGMCASVCGKVNVGTSELFYEEYQRRIGSTLPCETPVNDNSAFYFSCPTVEELQSILNTQGVTLSNNFERNIFCNDGKDSPGSCLKCESPLIGSIDVRLDDPVASCRRLECPTNIEFFQRINRLEEAFSINLNLAIFYSNVAFSLVGKNFGEAYNTQGGTGLSAYKPIDLYADCPVNSFISEFHHCCENTEKIINYEVLSIKGMFAEVHDPVTLSLQQCADESLSTDTYTIGGANVQLGPYRETSKGIFAWDGQCHIFRGFGDFDLKYVVDLQQIEKSNFVRNVGTGFTADDTHTIYRAYETCEHPTSRTFHIWQNSAVDLNTIKTISNTYELGCEFNNVYPPYFTEATDDIIDGQLVGTSIDPYTTNNERVIDIIDVIKRDQCVSLFYEYCAEGHSSNVQNPFLTYYAFMKVHEYLEKQFPVGSDQAGRCNIDILKSNFWCPQCPRCEYTGTVPGVDFELNATSKCEFGAFPYCKSKSQCEDTHWKETSDCDYAAPKVKYDLVDKIQQTVVFLQYTSTHLGSLNVEDCASNANEENTYRGYFIHDNCGEDQCGCYKVDSIANPTITGDPSKFLYVIDYSGNNGINTFEKYISKFTGGKDVSGSTMMGWYVERMRQAIPDKYRYFKTTSTNNLVEYIEQWLECTCVEDPNNLDHCVNFDVTSCLKFNPLQFEWEPLWFTRGSIEIPYEAPQKETEPLGFHDENGQGAVLRTSATLKSKVKFVENEIPDTCNEPSFDTYDVIPNTKIYNTENVECGKDVICSCDLGTMTDGVIDYEVEVVTDSLGQTLHHTECIEQIGTINSHSLNSCYLEAYKRFNFYDGSYYGSKGMFAVERPQIVNPQLFSSDEYLNYDFKNSNELTCYVYQNVDTTVVYSPSFNLMDTSKSVCIDVPNNKKGCARSIHLFRNLETNLLDGDTDLYTNKCNEPTFVQTYRSPHVSQTGNVFAQVQPKISGTVACYDYGPCFSVDNTGFTGTKYCNCRPSRFSESFPEIHYKNFADTPLHNLDSSEWGIINQDFTTAFGYWSGVRDKVAGEGEGGYTNMVFDTNEKDILNMCYDDMVVESNEVFKLSNRELQKDQYTGYHLLYDGITCPHFASLHKKNNERTRGRFATDLWTSSTRKYVEVSSGSPDLSVTEEECEAYAIAQGLGDSFLAYPYSGDPRGCYHVGNDLNRIEYNSASTTIPCGNIRNARQYNCIQLEDNDPKNMDGEIIRSSGHALLQKIHILRGGSQYYEQVSGSPDMTVSEQECEEYADSLGELFQSITTTYTDAPNGCSQINNNNVYFMYNQDGHNCGGDGYKCIQKRFGGDFNYIFGKALFMLDYRQVDMSTLYFGDPAFGTPVLGEATQSMPYESVIKSYCDAGEHPHKRFGPCVNLKSTRVNGKIYIKHFHDSEHYVVKELKTRDSKTSDEYYEMDSGAPDLSVNEAECEQFAEANGDTFETVTSTGYPVGCSCAHACKYAANGIKDCGNSGWNCIQKLDVSVEGDVLLEHDTVILIIKDGKFFAVSNFVAAHTETIEKYRFRMYTNTYNARSATKVKMFEENSMYDSHTCALHGATINPKINNPIEQVNDAFLFMRPQNEEIVKAGKCQPRQESTHVEPAVHPDSWGHDVICEDNNQVLTGVSYAPSCSCPSGFANVRYVDYNQPWSLHGGCSTIENDYSGAFIDYKLCNGRDTCNYIDTPFCCGHDIFNCNANYTNRCVDENGLPKLDTSLNDFCNRPFPGCSKKQRNGLAIDEQNIECGGPRATADTFNGMTAEWVKISDYQEGSRTTNDASNAEQGVFYVDGKPMDSMRSNYAIVTSGCYACTDGRYQSEEGQVECKGCIGGKYSISTYNPWTIPPTEASGYLKADRGESVFEYEWWKINAYPPQGIEWHEVNEWLVKKPLEPYFVTDDGMWKYNPTVDFRPAIAHNWQTDNFATECYKCPDNYASIPLDEDNYEVGDENLGYGAFPPQDSTRVLTNNRNCLVCPPGYDTGVANHLSIGISRSVAEECPYAYPFAFSTKDSAPYYGGYCCNNDEKRINPYWFHQTASDGCDNYVRCNSVFDYATNGYYCVDAVQDIPTHQIEVHIYNGETNICTDYITTDGLEFHYVCQFVEQTSGENDPISLDDCEKYAANNGIYLIPTNILDVDYRVSGCFMYAPYLYFNENQNDRQCSEDEICIHARKPASIETIKIIVDVRMMVDLEYISIEGQVNLILTIDADHPYIKEDTFGYIRVKRYVENYNILLDKDVSCNGIFLEKTYNIISFEFTLYHEGFEKISLATDVTEDECALLVIDYHKRTLNKTTIEAYFTLEGSACFTYPDEVCDGPCVLTALPGKTMQINLDGSNVTGSSCFLQSVLDVKEGSAYCRKCPAGKFNSRAGSNCLPCSIGKYQDEEGQITCKICENRKYQFLTGSSSCATCPPGSENKENDPINCNICKAGTYADDETGCKLCPAGKSINSNFADTKASEIRLSNRDVSLVTGPMINYDSTYDYTDITGFAEIDINGNYIDGFSPFFEGLQQMQLTSHDSESDCTFCNDGFTAAIGDPECYACPRGKYADVDNFGIPTCQFCVNGIVRYLQTTFVHTGNFLCHPLERMGEDEADIGIISEADFIYTPSSNLAFVDFVTLPSEDEAQDFCKKNYRCTGYSKKIMRDGTIEWRVPKGNEIATALATTYNTYENKVPDYYNYEKIDDPLCSDDDTCIGYYEDNLLSKTYHIMPFTPSDNLYVGEIFQTQKDAAKHCASTPSCEGVSTVETYDIFVAAEEVLTIGFHPDEILLTIPDQAVAYENPLKEVSTGAPALENVYEEVNFGTPVAAGWTRDDCYNYKTAYAPNVNFYDHASWTSTVPIACSKQTSTGEIYWNNAASSTADCSNDRICIQKSPNTVHVSQSECEQYANSNGLTWNGSPTSGNAKGCIKDAANRIEYNPGTNTATCGQYGITCIQKSYPQNVLSCRAYSLQHNYLFWDLVANYKYMEVDSGSPALEGPTYVTESECEAHAGSTAFYSGSWGSAPKGCYKSSGFFYYSNHATSTQECTTDWICIQKDTNQLTMLCHVGNTLQ